MIPSFFWRMGVVDSPSGTPARKVSRTPVSVRPPVSPSVLSPSRPGKQQQTHLPFQEDTHQNDNPNLIIQKTGPDPHISDRKQSGRAIDKHKLMKSRSENPTVHIEGHTIKSKVLLSCLKPGSDANEMRARVLLMEKFSTFLLSDVSFELNCEPQEQEARVTNAIVGAVVQAVSLLITDANLTLNMHNNQCAACGAQQLRGPSESFNTNSLNISFQEIQAQTSSHGIQLANDLASTLVSSRSQSSATDDADSVCTPPNLRPRNIVRIVHDRCKSAGGPSIVKQATSDLLNTPKVLKIADKYQCYFCGFRGCKELVKSVGAHHIDPCPKNQVVTTAKLFERLAGSGASVPVPGAQVYNQAQTPRVAPLSPKKKQSQPLAMERANEFNDSAMQQRKRDDTSESTASSSYYQVCSEDVPYSSFYAHNSSSSRRVEMGKAIIHGASDAASVINGQAGIIQRGGSAHTWPDVHDIYSSPMTCIAGLQEDTPDKDYSCEILDIKPAQGTVAARPEADDEFHHGLSMALPGHEQPIGIPPIRQQQAMYGFVSHNAFLHQDTRQSQPNKSSMADVASSLTNKHTKAGGQSRPFSTNNYQERVARTRAHFEATCYM